MKRTLSIGLVAGAALACADDPLGALATSERHAPLRTPCQATEAMLIVVDKVRCGSLPTPSTSVDVWDPKDRPKAVRFEDADGRVVEEATYEYRDPLVFSGATYRDDGNIETVKLVDLGLPEDMLATYHYEYRDGTFIGAYAITRDGMRTVDSEVRYEDGRRSSDGIGPGPEGHFHYRYDTDGRLVAKIGGAQLDVLPEQPNAEMLQRSCGDWVVPAVPAAIENGMTGATYYFRNSEGQITNMAIGGPPGSNFARATFEYDGRRVTSIVTECSSFDVLGFGNWRRIYMY